MSSHYDHKCPDHRARSGPGGTVLAGAVITVSDRCAAGEREDVSGPLAAQLLSAHGVSAPVTVVPDGTVSVREAVLEALLGGARIVLTTGGTGVGPRDRTPEATRDLVDLDLPGLAQAVRDHGVREGGVRSACLSRGIAGVVLPEGRAGVSLGAIAAGGALVVNAPGSPGGVRDAVAVLGPLAVHMVHQLDGGDH